MGPRLRKAVLLRRGDYAQIRCWFSALTGANALGDLIPKDLYGNNKKQALEELIMHLDIEIPNHSDKSRE